jgi:ribonucleoside-diphosphate reductase alpha chain
VKENEWDELGQWLWDNRHDYNGISVLPYFGAEAYPQLPFEDITKEVYESMLPAYHSIRVDLIREADGTAVDLAAELACAGGNCEVN